MKKVILLNACLILILNIVFSQASSVDNLKRATAKELGNDTRTDDVTISNIKRKATSVKWYAKVKDVCYEGDADDMVRSVHLAKIDCSLTTAEAAPAQKEKAGPQDPLGAAVYKKMHEKDAPKQETTKQEPAKPANSPSPADELAKWKKLLDDGVINKEEYEAQKKKILNQ